MLHPDVARQPRPVAVDDPIKSYHNLSVTRESIKQMLAGGVPNLCKWPEDYRQFAKESFEAEREQSIEMAKSYQMEEQDLLSNEAARKVNPIGTRIFIDRLRKMGVKCFTVDNGLKGTVALWAAKPGIDDVIYCCYCQVPAMFEWSVLRLDKWGLANGEKFRGWRTVLAQLIDKEILTEAAAHSEFGKPTLSEVSRRYRRSLWFTRNKAKRKNNS
jgi:hypothetical protein